MVMMEPKNIWFWEEKQGILAIFDLQVTPMSPTKFESIGLSVQERS